MSSQIYLTITVLAVSGIWFVWDLGIKKLLLDVFRERLFELRFRLFEMGESGELPFDSDAYRSIETLLCGLLRFGHRLTFMRFILSALEQERAKKSKDYVDYAQQIELKVSRTPAATQDKLQLLLSDVHKTVTVYVSISSLLFMAGVVVISILRAFNFCRDLTKRKVSSVLESEAYRAESSRSGFGNIAVA
jgi:hypothetical protein